jgi:hypothetical protein
MNVLQGAVTVICNDCGERIEIRPESYREIARLTTYLRRPNVVHCWRCRPA